MTFLGVARSNRTALPLLFLIHINDLPSAVQDSTVSMYADDTSLCLKSRDISQLNKAINDDLEHLDSWLKGNKLSLNVAKTPSILIATKPKHRAFNNAAERFHLTIRGNELDIVNKTKYLGIHADNSLDWKEHIKAVSTKSSRAIGFLKQATNILPIASLKTLYSSIVEPWSPIFDTTVLSGIVVAKLIMISSKSFKTELPEL